MNGRRVLRIEIRRTVPLFFAAAMGALLSSMATAQEAGWNPPEPPFGSKDWVKLTSGEWLRGEIDLFRDEKLYFDSDDLDDLVIDWEDVAEIRSPRILTFTFFDGGVAAGSCGMRDGIIKIDTGTEVLEFKRTVLSSILEGKPRELNFWSFKATLGIIARTGNSKQSDAAVFARIRREAMRSRFDLSYTGNLGTVQDTSNVDNHRVDSSFNAFISRRLFVTPVAVEYFADRFQNIDYRLMAGAGVGYYLWRQGNFDWYLQLGGAYQDIRYLSVEPGENQVVESGTIIPVLNLDWDITGDIEFELDYDSKIGVPEVKNTFHYLFALLSIELSDYLDLDTDFQWNHNENPVADANGVVPVRDDFRYSVGIGVDI
jgi:hypothetical protein